jgi:hypothetical protein
MIKLFLYEPVFSRLRISDLIGKDLRFYPAEALHTKKQKFEVIDHGSFYSLLSSRAGWTDGHIVFLDKEDLPIIGTLSPIYVARKVDLGSGDEAYTFMLKSTLKKRRLPD